MVSLQLPRSNMIFFVPLVDRKLIPDDVEVQVLVQCREHLIKRTFEAIEGHQESHCTYLQFHIHSSERCGVSTKI